MMYIYWYVHYNWNWKESQATNHQWFYDSIETFEWNIKSESNFGTTIISAPNTVMKHVQNPWRKFSKSTRWCVKTRQKRCPKRHINKEARPPLSFPAAKNLRRKLVSLKIQEQICATHCHYLKSDRFACKHRLLKNLESIFYVFPWF